MSKMEVDFPKELESKGMSKSCGNWYGYPYPPVEFLNQPITPAENLRRYMSGEDYEWIPDLKSDQFEITPDCNLDAYASDFEGGYDAFGVKWIPVENNDELPAFVEPGYVVLDDITEWEKLEWPDVESWEWEKGAALYNETYKDDPRMRRGVVLSGYFERLISLMTFEEAAVAMLMEPDAVAAFFDKLTELNIQIMDHYIKDFGCKAILIHDDWSAQRSPFFSLDIAMELLAPQLKKLTDHAHAQGILFTLHSCGNGTDLIPAMKAGGVDAWMYQEDAVDFEKAYEAAGDDLMLETFIVVPDGIYGEELEAYVRDTLLKYCQKHRGFVSLGDMDPERCMETRRIIYKVGRELAASGQMK